MVQGQIFNDPMGINEDGYYVRLSNVMYALAYDDALIVATKSCLYRLPRNEECKNE